jgi:hypothetical protein
MDASRQSFARTQTMAKTAIVTLISTPPDSLPVAKLEALALSMGYVVAPISKW